LDALDTRLRVFVFVADVSGVFLLTVVVFFADVREDFFGGDEVFATADFRINCLISTFIFACNSLAVDAD